MHFGTKSYLKSNHNHTAKQTLKQNKQYSPEQKIMTSFYYLGIQKILKNIKNNFIFIIKKKSKPNRNRFKLTGFGSVFQDKNRFKPVWLGFGLVFSVWLGFFTDWFFQFQTYKTEIEPVGFFKILISFFTVRFFRLYFFQFSRFNQFFNFFTHLSSWSS